MHGASKKAMNLKKMNLYIHFIGDVDRGKKLQEIVESYDLKFHFKIDMHPAQNIFVHCIPDLVILDNFPESKTARSVFYQLRQNKDVRFISLNNSPDAIKYIHVNSLSFIRMIHRDPKPKELINAISDLVESKCELYSQHPRTVKFARKTVECKSIDLSGICRSGCC